MYCYWITAIFVTAISDFYLELLIIFYPIVSSSSFLQCILIYTRTFIELYFYTLFMYFNVCISVKRFEALLSRKRYINVSLFLFLLLFISCYYPPNSFQIHNILLYTAMYVGPIQPSATGPEHVVRIKSKLITPQIRVIHCRQLTIDDPLVFVAIETMFVCRTEYLSGFVFVKVTYDDSGILFL